MIETKEQYERIFPKAEMDLPVALYPKAIEAVYETIEALRDRLKFAIRRYDIDGDALDELLDGLPDWITDD